MISNSIFKEGTNLLKEMNSLNRKVKITTNGSKKAQSPIKTKIETIDLVQANALKRICNDNTIDSMDNNTNNQNKLFNVNHLKTNSDTNTSYTNNKINLNVQYKQIITTNITDKPSLVSLKSPQDTDLLSNRKPIKNMPDNKIIGCELKNKINTEPKAHPIGNLTTNKNVSNLEVMTSPKSYQQEAKLPSKKAHVISGGLTNREKEYKNLGCRRNTDYSKKVMNSRTEGSPSKVESNSADIINKTEGDNNEKIYIGLHDTIDNSIGILREDLDNNNIKPLIIDTNTLTHTITTTTATNNKSYNNTINTDRSSINTYNPDICLKDQFIEGINECSSPNPSASSIASNLKKIKTEFNTPQSKPLPIQSKIPQTEIKNENHIAILDQKIYDKPAKWKLTDEEKSTYGDRFPEEYQKLDFLGRGGFALVWLGVDRQTGRKVAVKQMLKNQSTDSQKKELEIGQFLFEKNGIPKEDFKLYEGITNIIGFIDAKITRYDIWYIMELGGSTLSKLMYDIKGEFFKGERVYGIKYLDLYNKFHRDSRYLKLFISEIANVLHLLSDCEIIHSDLKPDNILIEFLPATTTTTAINTTTTTAPTSMSNSQVSNVKGNTNTTNPNKLFKLKIIDFGSASSFTDLNHINMTTPEYMPPEILELLLNNNNTNKAYLDYLRQTCQTWSIDIWSFGSILLEIITGIPLWLSLKCKVETNNKKIFKTGLFAVKGRSYDKILIKQKYVIDNLKSILNEYISQFDNPHLLLDLISSMMIWNPSKRISPVDILNHPYVNT